jgi:hypothetical protein
MWAQGSEIQKPLDPRDPRAPLGAGTPIGVRGLGWVPGFGTQKLIDHMALL